MVVSIVITILVMGCAPHLSPPHAGHGVTDPGALDYAMDLLTLPPPPPSLPTCRARTLAPWTTR